MPKQPPTTPESDVPLTERAKRLFGVGMRGKDIRLPQEGKRDPRLGAEPADLGKSIREGYEVFKGLGKKTSSRALQRPISRRA